MSRTSLHADTASSLKVLVACRGFKSLLDLVDNTTHDSFELYYGLFMYNQVCSRLILSTMPKSSPDVTTYIACTCVMHLLEVWNERQGQLIVFEETDQRHSHDGSIVADQG